MHNWGSNIEGLAERLLSQKYFEELIERIAETMERARTAGDAMLLTRTANPVGLARARALADNAARSLVKDMTQAQLKSMGDTIAQALAEGKRPKDIYSKLQEVQALDSNRVKALDKFSKTLEQSGVDPAKAQKMIDKEKERLLQERRKTIAQTEGRKATSEARRSEADERGNKWKRWIATGDERMCDICGGNADAGVIALDDSFPDGSDQTPAHPNCRCTISYLPDGKAKEIAERRAAREREERAVLVGALEDDE